MWRTPSRRSGEKSTRQRNKLVIDTGVLVSAFAFGGTPREAVRRAVAEDLILVSPDLLKEYREVPVVLAKRGKIDNRQFMALIAGIAAVVAKAGLVHPKKRLEICRDPEDDMRLECCLTAKADLLVTGDLDLQTGSLGSFTVFPYGPRLFLILSIGKIRCAFSEQQLLPAVTDRCRLRSSTQ